MIAGRRTERQDAITRRAMRTSSEPDAHVTSKCAYDSQRTLELAATDSRLPFLAAASPFLRRRGDVIVKLQPSWPERGLGTPHETLPRATQRRRCAIGTRALFLGCSGSQGLRCSMVRFFFFMFTVPNVCESITVRTLFFFTL